MGGMKWWDPVGNDYELLVGQALLCIEINHTGTVGDNSFRPARQVAIDLKLIALLPRVNTTLARHDVLHAGRESGNATIAVGGKQPGMDQIGLKLRNEPPQAKIGKRI